MRISKPCNKYRASKLRPRCKTVESKKKVTKKKASKKVSTKKQSKKVSKKQPSKRKRRKNVVKPPDIPNIDIPEYDYVLPEFGNKNILNIPGNIVYLLEQDNRLWEVFSSIDQLVGLLELKHDRFGVLQLLDGFVRNDQSPIASDDIVSVWQNKVKEAISISANRSIIPLESHMVNMISDLCLVRFMFNDLSDNESGKDAIEFGKEDSSTVKEILEKKILGKDIDVVEVINILSIF